MQTAGSFGHAIIAAWHVEANTLCAVGHTVAYMLSLHAQVVLLLLDFSACPYSYAARNSTPCSESCGVVGLSKGQ